MARLKCIFLGHRDEVVRSGAGSEHHTSPLLGTNWTERVAIRHVRCVRCGAERVQVYNSEGQLERTVNVDIFEALAEGGE